jgi:hypothetical protein
VFALRYTGRHAGPCPRLAARVAAHGLGFGPLIAEAELELSWAFEAGSDYKAQSRALLDAIAAADASRRDDIRAHAYLQLYLMIGAQERKASKPAVPPSGAGAIARLGERQTPGAS